MNPVPRTPFLDATPKVETQGLIVVEIPQHTHLAPHLGDRDGDDGDRVSAMVLKELKEGVVKNWNMLLIGS